MKNIWEIIRNELKRSYVSYLIILAVFGIVYFTSLLFTSFVFKYTVNNGINAIYYDRSYLYGIFVTLASIFLIFINFSYNKNRVSVDLTYSLPISKRTFFVSKYLITVGEVIVTSIIFYLLFLVKLSMVDTIFDVGIFTIYFLLQTLSCVSMVSFLIPAYYYGNNIIDGIIYMLFFSFIIPLFFATIGSVTLNFDIFGGSILSSPTTVPFALSSTIKGMLGDEPFSTILFSDSFIGIISGLTFIYGFIPIILSIVFVSKDKTERVQQVDTSYLGYRVFIPLTFYLIAIAIRVETLNVPLIVAVTVGMYILYAIYRKSLKIKKSDLLFLGGLVALLIVMPLIYSNVS